MSAVTGVAVLAMTLVFFSTILYFTVGVDIRKNKLEKIVIHQALQGNEFALKIMNRPSIIRSNDKDVILHALNGNQFALKILGIDEIERSRN